MLPNIEKKLINHIDSMEVTYLPIIPYESEAFTGFKCSIFLSIGRLLKVHTLILSKIKKTFLQISRHSLQTENTLI